MVLYLFNTFRFNELSQMSNKLEFKVLALDTSNESVVHTEKGLLHAFLANDSLWNDSKLDESRFRITDGDLILEVRRVNADRESDTDIGKAFLLTVKADYNCLEPKRVEFLKLLKDQKFDYLYVLLDEVSEKIANSLYPLIYKVENSLRAYIVEFMTARIGAKWWGIMAADNLSEKVQKRKNNEKEFAGLIDNKLYLIDIGDLGEMIYAPSYGTKKTHNIINEISKLDENSPTLKDDIQKLKKDVESNYQKFFNESFRQKKFQEKWQELEKIRNKVAHNNLFTDVDLKRGKILSADILGIIKMAGEKVDQITLRSEEREEIEESFDFKGFRLREWKFMNSELL